MKKIAVFLMWAVLAVLCCQPVYAKQPQQHNKYQGRDKASRQAQKREEKSIRKYEKAQRKYQHKMLKGQKHSKYGPKKHR